MKKSDFETVELSVDNLGEILFYKNRVFRAINDIYIEQVQHMISSGFINEIIEKKLFPNTWISDMNIDGYSLVIEHEIIEHWNYPYEWSFDMLKDASLAVLKVNTIANKYGYQIMDGHAYNIVFNMNKPQYIDFGSFVRVNEDEAINWRSYKSFYNHFYMPLYLWSKGYPDIAKNIFLMRDFFSEKEFLKIKYPFINIFGNNTLLNILEKIQILSLSSDSKIKSKLQNKFKRNMALIIKKLFKSSFNIEKIKKQIIGFEKPIEYSMWNDYHDDIDPKTDKRFMRITELINNLNDAESVVEVASNQGKFAAHIMENTHINKIIATDYDNEAVNIMYKNNKNKDNFMSLLFDMVRTNGRKYDKHINERINADIVIGLAVTHHLILTQNIDINYIFNSMKKLTNKYIIVEFMPMGLYAGDLTNIPDLPSFYSLDWFKNNFIEYFDLIVDEKLEINRHVFFGKLKRKNY